MCNNAGLSEYQKFIQEQMNLNYTNQFMSNQNLWGISIVFSGIFLSMFAIIGTVNNNLPQDFVVLMFILTAVICVTFMSNYKTVSNMCGRMIDYYKSIWDIKDYNEDKFNKEDIKQNKMATSVKLREKIGYTLLAIQFVLILMFIIPLS